MSLIFVLPVCCLAYFLFEYYLRNKGELSVVTSENQLKRWKIWTALVCAVIGAILCILWLAIIWGPENSLTFIIKILFIILLLPFILLLVIAFAFLNALGSAVKAGGSSTKAITKTVTDVFKEEQPTKKV